MGRYRSKHLRRQKAKVVVIQAPSRRDHQLWWNLSGLLLALITGVIIPFYFQSQSNQFQLTEMQSLSTIQALQSTVNAHTTSFDSTSSLDSTFSFDPFHLTLAPPPTPTHGKSYIRLVDASPDVATTDVFMNGKHLLSDFQFGTMTDYVVLTPGPHTVTVGMLSEEIPASVMTQTLLINSGDIYTFVVWGTEAKGFQLQGIDQTNLT